MRMRKGFFLDRNLFRPVVFPGSWCLPPLGFFFLVCAEHIPVSQFKFFTLSVLCRFPLALTGRLLSTKQPGWGNDSFQGYAVYNVCTVGIVKSLSPLQFVHVFFFRIFVFWCVQVEYLLSQVVVLLYVKYLIMELLHLVFKNVCFWMLMFDEKRKLES